MSLEELKCHNCGAPLSWRDSHETEIYTCKYCGSIYRIKTKDTDPSWFKDFKEGRLDKNYYSTIKPSLEYHFVNPVKRPFILGDYGIFAILMLGILLGTVFHTFLPSGAVTDILVMLAFFSPIGFVFFEEYWYTLKSASKGYFITTIKNGKRQTQQIEVGKI